MRLNVRSRYVGGPLGWQVEVTGNVLPILSAVVKIARFMVVQKATELVTNRYDYRYDNFITDERTFA